MYTVRHVLPELRTDARGLTLHEAFMRLMALSERHYRFTRTGWRMHILMTDPPPDEPEFSSGATNDAVARQEIMRQVCAHGLGKFTVMLDKDYVRLIAGEKVAAE